VWLIGELIKKLTRWMCLLMVIGRSDGSSRPRHVA
jgi:hypothetical protein